MSHRYKLIKMINEISLKDLFSYVISKIHFDKDKIIGNFILTDDVNKRLEKVDHLTKSKIPIMLLGPTETSKTKTILVWCDLKKQEFKQKETNLMIYLEKYKPKF